MQLYIKKNIKRRRQSKKSLKKIKQMLDKCINIHTYTHSHIHTRTHIRRQLHMYAYFGNESFNKALQLYPKNRVKNKKAQLNGEKIKECQQQQQESVENCSKSEKVKVFCARGGGEYERPCCRIEMLIYRYK